jgi:hypothetical protein
MDKLGPFILIAADVKAVQMLCHSAVAALC